MKKIIWTVLMTVAVLPLAAQETYEIAGLSATDLNGTARYVGMGGALEALGAEISTMSTNPAGIGLFRHSQIRGSMGVVSQQDVNNFGPSNKTNVSFDQIGFVWSTNTSGRKQSFVNFGFNYHKSRNLNQILNVVDRLDGASQSKLTYEKFRNGLITNSDDLRYSQTDALYNELLYDNTLVGVINNPDPDQDLYPRYYGTDYTFNRSNTGYISEFDFNISGNINNRVYLGATVGVYDIHYDSYTEYDEGINPLGQKEFENTLDEAFLTDSRHITGSGVDFKFGVIFRPVENSPFRVGLYINSPTFYKIKTNNFTALTLAGTSNANPTQVVTDYKDRNGANEYEFRTPWKFGASLGHTVGNYLALGATYEFADYSATDARIPTGSGGYYDYYYWDEYYSYSNSESDSQMNQHIRKTLKGVSTLKLGAEFKPDKNLAVRLGYNYISPMYEEDAYRGVEVKSWGNYDSSVTDYVNWKAINRITCGVGFTLDKFVIDLAYQYSTQKGEFLPFTGSDDDNYKNLPFARTVENNRHQALLTLGYNF